MAAEVLRECAIWLRQQNTIQHVCTSNGGWERWAHLDFGAFLKSKDYKVAHDDRCFDGSNETDSFTVEDVACVELKTFGYQLNALELIQAYKARMHAARQKLGRHSLNDDCEDNDKFCVGIANEKDVILGLRYMFNNNNICATNFMKIMKGFFGTEYEHAVVSSPSGARWIVSFAKVD